MTLTSKPQTHSAKKLPAALERELAVKASCDPRTIRAYVAGRTVLELPRRRIEAALRDAGLGNLLRGHQP